MKLNLSLQSHSSRIKNTSLFMSVLLGFSESVIEVHGTEPKCFSSRAERVVRSWDAGRVPNALTCCTRLHAKVCVNLDKYNLLITFILSYIGFVFVMHFMHKQKMDLGSIACSSTDQQMDLEYIIS